jgi:hypothetical protein
MNAAPDGTFPSLLNRMVGMVRGPRRTLRAVIAAPRWADVLLASFAVAAASSAAVLMTNVGRLALLDQWERTILAFGGEVTDARYAAMLDASTQGALYYALGTALVSGPLLAVAVSIVAWVMLRPQPDSPVAFRQLLAVAAHAGVILALRQLVAAPVVYARESLASPMTLASVVPGLDEASSVARFLGAFDVFVLWWVVVLTLGLSILYRRSAIRLAVVSMGLYGALAAVIAVMVALLGSSS